MTQRRKSLNLLFVADPIATFNPVSETTIQILREAGRRGHRVFTTTPERLSARNQEVLARCERLKISPKPQSNWYRVESETSRSLKSFDAIFLRKDPPFDLDYLNHLYLLDRLSSEVYFMNHPAGILRASEKILPLNFPEFIPDTLISGDRAALLDFIAEHPEGTILKPINSSGGRGIFHLRSPKSENILVTLETMTGDFRHMIIAQAYLPAVKQGDKRVLLLGDQVLGSFLRRAAPGEHRSNLHAGGHLVAAKLSRRDRAIVAAVAPTLRSLGLDFVGLDLIGDCLTEINVTSPMGVREINFLEGGKCEGKILDFVEGKV